MTNTLTILLKRIGAGGVREISIAKIEIYTAYMNINLPHINS